MFIYIDTWMVARKADFYSSLNMKNITDIDYKNVTIFYQEFRTKNSGGYHVFFIQSDKSLLSGVSIIFRNICLQIYELDLAHFFLHKN